MKTLSKLLVILPLVTLAITSHAQTIEKKSLDLTGAKKAIAAATGPAPITSANHPRSLGFTSTELPNARWRR